MSWYIKIYRIPPLSLLGKDQDSEVGNQSDDDITKPIWKYPNGTIDTDLTVPSFTFDGTGYRLVFQAKRDIVGIYIPPSPEDSPCVHFRMSLQYVRPVVVGLRKGCGVIDDGPALRFGYGWDDDVNTNFVNGRDVVLQSVSSKMLFDEETGCCLARKSLEEVHVYEFLAY